MINDCADNCPYRVADTKCSCLIGLCKESFYSSCVHRLRADCSYLKGLIEEAHQVIASGPIIDADTESLISRMEATF